MPLGCLHMTMCVASFVVRYAFVEYENEEDMRLAYKRGDGRKIDGRRVLVDVERGRTVRNWLVSDHTPLCQSVGVTGTWPECGFWRQRDMALFTASLASMSIKSLFSCARVHDLYRRATSPVSLSPFPLHDRAATDASSSSYVRVHTRESRKVTPPALGRPPLSLPSDILVPTYTSLPRFLFSTVRSYVEPSPPTTLTTNAHLQPRRFGGGLGDSRKDRPKKGQEAEWRERERLEAEAKEAEREAKREKERQEERARRDKEREEREKSRGGGDAENGGVKDRDGDGKRADSRERGRWARFFSSYVVWWQRAEGGRGEGVSNPRVRVLSLGFWNVKECQQVVGHLWTTVRILDTGVLCLVRGGVARCFSREGGRVGCDGIFRDGVGACACR